ncbi:hypothetical protein GW17_00038852 [Ensete ventricosum]|nr:hypothetical protein GW17_00038852 [Ensete ventricosum]
MDIDGTVIWVVCVVGIVFGGVEVSGLGVEAAHLPEGRNPRIPFDLVPAAGEEQKETESRGRRAREEQTSGERDEVDAVWVEQAKNYSGNTSVLPFCLPVTRLDENFQVVGAFIVSATGRSYLRSLLSLLLTMPSYFTTPSVVLAARRPSCFLQLWHVDLAHLTRFRSVVRLLTPPCLCQAGSTVSGRPRWRSSCPRARGRGSQVNICHIIPPVPEKTFSRFPTRVLKMRSCAEPSVYSGVKLVPKASSTEQGFGK